ncbi:hypothetical protein MKW98_007769 [Papaver atlanticum]|uniref:Cytochrome P450 n=1 Tax=Papaver atlanticum TaxID=357466 RepID=A0AAD4RYM7_9MAGN|nr:hypothetical protein MKW98_007769 [Papaver atlanticum]
MDDLLLKIYMVLLSALVFLLSLYSLKFFQSILIKTKQHEGTTAVEPPGATGWPIIGETLDFGRANLKGFPEKFFYDGFEEVIVYPLVKIYTFSMACWFLLSVDDECLVHELLKPFNVVVDGFASLPINLPGTPLNRGIKASKFIRNEFEKIVKQRMNQMHLFGEGEEKETILPQPPAKDMLSQMIMFSDNNPEDDEANVTDDHNNQKKKKFMSATYIADLILCLMAAGYHTTSTVITVLMKFLADFPDVLNGVLLVLRLAPPFQGGFTEALTDFTYAGYFIPKGRKLYWTGISSHMNPENFPDPEKFDPSRFQGKGPAPYTFVPFGGGAGMCPGYEYARVEILVFLHHVVRRYKWEKLIPGNINERLKVNPYPLPPKGFPIRLQPRTT